MRYQAFTYPEYHDHGPVLLRYMWIKSGRSSVEQVLILASKDGVPLSEAPVVHDNAGNAIRATRMIGSWSSKRRMEKFVKRAARHRTGGSHKTWRLPAVVVERVA